MNITTNIRLIIVSSLTACTALLAMPGTARGQIIYETNSGGNTIGEYDASTGAAINAALVSGLNLPQDIVVSGGNLWVSNQSGNTIGEYNASTGATVNASLVSGLNGPVGLEEYGGNLFVSQSGINTIGEYNAVTGATVNASLFSGLNSPTGIEAVPEPATWAAGLLTGGALLCSIWRRRAGLLTLLRRRKTHAC